MGECSDCSGTDCREEECLSNQGRGKRQDFFEKTHELNRVRKVIGIVSGKGGVGKSLVTSISNNQYLLKGVMKIENCCSRRNSKFR